MSGGSTNRAISREGVVRDAAGGCATIDVSVPCSSCPQGACFARRQSASLHLDDLAEQGAAVTAGDRVTVSVASGQLTGVCLALFGPGLAWLLALAAFSSQGILELADPWLAGWVSVCGLVCALAIGSGLGRRAARAMPRRILVRALDPMPGSQRQAGISDRLPGAGTSQSGIGAERG